MVSDAKGIHQSSELAHLNVTVVCLRAVRAILCTEGDETCVTLVWWIRIACAIQARPPYITCERFHGDRSKCVWSKMHRSPYGKKNRETGTGMALIGDMFCASLRVASWLDMLCVWVSRAGVSDTRFDDVFPTTSAPMSSHPCSRCSMCGQPY